MKIQIDPATDQTVDEIQDAICESLRRAECLPRVGRNFEENTIVQTEDGRRFEVQLWEIK